MFLFALITDALACSCGSPTRVLPDVAGAPSNARLLVIDGWSTSENPDWVASIIDEEGAEIPSTTVPLADNAVQLVPDGPLPPVFTIVTLTGQWLGLTLDGPEDLTPPTGAASPEFEERSSLTENDGSCRTHWSLTATFGAPEDDSGFALVEVEAAEDPDFTDPIRWYTTSGAVYSGVMCAPDIPVSRGDQHWWRARPVDLAGNVGDWSEAAQDPACGCTSAGSSVGWLWVAGLLAARRRAAR